MINIELYIAYKALIMKLYEALIDDNKKRTGILHSKYFESKKAVALKWKEYNICSEIIDSDERIKELYNELINDGMYHFCFRSSFDVIAIFVTNYYEEYAVFNAEIFKEYYSNFEDFLYKRISYHFYNVRLYNFVNSTHTDIVISENLTLKYEPLNNDKSEFDSVSDYIIECIVEVNWVIQRIEKVLVNDPIKKANLLFDNFIKAVRLLKKNNVYRDEQVFQQTTNPAWAERIIFNNIRQKNNMYGKNTELTNFEYDELKSILNYINSGRKTGEEKKKFKNFDVALTRLHYGVERDNFDDKLIDFMIALEAMYLPDGNSELTFRLSLRASLLLNEKSSAKEDFKFLRKMYDARSSIVHGNTSTVSKDEIEKLEDITRKSLKLWVEDESLFTVEKLNNIFFK